MSTATEQRQGSRGNRTWFILATGIWLAFLVASLALPLLYLHDPPSPIGTGLLRVFGWGSVAGIGISAVVLRMYWRFLDERVRGSKVMLLLGCCFQGIFGGASAAALLDQSQVAKAYAVELPIVKIERLPARRRSEPMHIATLAPFVPSNEQHIPITDVRGRVLRAGDCLAGVMQRGWLGGTYVQSFTARPCSPARGSAATHVLTIDGRFASWRWYAPRDYRRIGPRQASDAAIPANLSCLTQKGSWLYRCTRACAGGS